MPLIEYKKDYIADFLRVVVGRYPSATVLTHLDWPLLLALDSGWLATSAAAEVAGALGRGEPVWVPRETLPPPPKNPARGRAMLCRAVERGLCPVGLGELPLWLARGARREGLLAAETARELIKSGVRGVFLPPSAVVTPLAAAELKRAGIRLVWREKQCGWDGWLARCGAPKNVPN